MSAVTGIVLVNYLFFVRFVSPVRVSELRLTGSSACSIGDMISVRKQISCLLCYFLPVRLCFSISLFVDWFVCQPFNFSHWNKFYEFSLNFWTEKKNK